MQLSVGTRDSSICDLVTHSLTDWLSDWILISDNDYNDYSDYSDNNDYNDYNEYNDNRDNDLDLDWERFSYIVT